MFNWYCPLNYDIELEKKTEATTYITFWVKFIAFCITLVYYILRQKLLHFGLIWHYFCIKSYYILGYYYILRQLLHFVA